MTQTQFYKLNSWAAEDRILRADFNADNAKLDTALHTLDGKTAALEGKIAAERTYCNDKIAATDGKLAATDSKLDSHSHFVKLQETTLTALTAPVTQLKLDLSPSWFTDYHLIRMDTVIKGSGNWYLRPNDTLPEQAKYSALMDNSTTVGGITLLCGGGGCASTFFFPGKNTGNLVQCLSVGQYLFCGSVLNNLTFKTLRSLLFFNDVPSFLMQPGTCVTFWGLN